MTDLLISGTPDEMRGRKQVNFESAIARLPLGTLDRIKAVLAPPEKQADFLKSAIEAELKRRERKPKGQP